MVLRIIAPVLIGALVFFMVPCCIADHNYTGYDNYSDVIEWEHVDNQNGRIVAHYYQWNNHLTSRENRERYYNPVFFGLPNDTNLSMGGGPIQWTYLRIVGPKYAVLYNDKRFSNSSDVIYEVGYLPIPKTSLNGVTIDGVTADDLYLKLHPWGFDKYTVNITCEWHKSTRRARGGVKKQFHTTKMFQNTLCKIEPWIKANEYNQTVECTITNHSGFYSTINMTGLPVNASAYNISVQMGNVTKSLIKSSYVFFKNDSVDYQLYDMHDYDYYTLNGISPFGKGEFFVTGGYVDDVFVTVSSPFESYELRTNVTRIDEEKEIDTKDIVSALMCLISAYVLYRMLMK